MIQLIKRNFNFKTINNIIIEIGKKDRVQLLPYKNNINNLDNNLKLFIKYDFNYDFLNKSIYELYKRISNDYLFIYFEKSRLGCEKLDYMKNSTSFIFIR